MKTVALRFNDGAIEVVDIPTPVVGDNAILVANTRSLLSAGTEGAVIAMARKGPLGKALERPDLFKQVLTKARLEGLLSTAKVVRNLITAPMPLGYSCAGTVLRAGRLADRFRPGDRVACAGLGMANHAEQVCVPPTMAARIPDNVSDEEAAFGTLGAIALHGVRLSGVSLGGTAVVLGLGLIGQLTVQILRAMGCRVAGFDLSAAKVELARSLGMEAGGVMGRDDPQALTAALTGGHGADAVLICAHAKSNQPLVTACDLAREKGCIVAVGLVKLDVPRRAFFQKELRLEVSRAYGAGAYDDAYERKGRDYPLPYVRWTEGRNLEAFLNLLASGSVRVAPLVSHRFPLEQAKAAYDMVLSGSEPSLGVLFTYPGTAETASTVRLAGKPSAGGPSAFNFGIIGPGRFAQAVLIPALHSHRKVRIAAVASAGGMSARHVAEKYKADMCTSDYAELLARPDIGSVLVATRHTLHARIVAEALAAGKNVFVEKPLATSPQELALVEAARAAGGGRLLVGFNRRFSPLCRTFAARLANRSQPLVLTHRFLTPRLLKGNESQWVHDPEQGGNRIIGEVCHMVDTASFLVGARPRTVYARSVDADADAIPNYDNLIVTLGYADGSVAGLTYTANSDASLPQERIELHWEGAFGLIDNFRHGFVSRDGRRKSWRGLSQRKGWSEEMDAFVACLEAGGQDPIPFESLAETTRVTFLIEESLRTGQVLTLDRPAGAGEEAS
jgi:predicted dehydrogenase/threonine dehydrogenase-like Zn-dependent dehydrogenase